MATLPGAENGETEKDNILINLGSLNAILAYKEPTEKEITKCKLNVKREELNALARHATRTESLLFLSVGDLQSSIRRGIPRSTKKQDARNIFK